jgi:hypothetical protein
VRNGLESSVLWSSALAQILKQSELFGGHGQLTLIYFQMFRIHTSCHYVCSPLKKPKT